MCSNTSCDDANRSRLPPSAQQAYNPWQRRSEFKPAVDVAYVERLRERGNPYVVRTPLSAAQCEQQQQRKAGERRHNT